MTQIVANVTSILTLIGASVGGAITICIYRRNSSLRRSEWLYSLFKHFFCESSYAQVRQMLDYEKPEEISSLRKALELHSDQGLEEAMVNYLNFFEFIASLYRLRQLTMQELCMVFDYYIRRLGDYPFIMNYLTSQGFEGLLQLVHAVRGRTDLS